MHDTYMTPAHVLGLDGAPCRAGGVANLAALDDDLQVSAVIVNGH